MRQPVRDVGRIEELALERNIAIQQIRRVHYLIDIECIVGEYDTPIGSTELKCLENGGSIINRLAEVSKRLRIEVARSAIVNNKPRD